MTNSFVNLVVNMVSHINENSIDSEEMYEVIQLTSKVLKKSRQNERIINKKVSTYKYMKYNPGENKKYV